MAVLGTTVATLGDVAKRLDKDGKIDKIVELLSETNEVLDDMLFQEGNLPTGHRTTIRTGLPEVAWRLLNYGVPQSKSQTQQITDTCGMLEAYAEVDKALADLNNNTAASASSGQRHARQETARPRSAHRKAASPAPGCRGWESGKSRHPR